MDEGEKLSDINTDDDRSLDGRESVDIGPTKVNTYKMKMEKCYDCIVTTDTIDPNKDDYLRREWKGKALTFHTVCHTAWRKKQGKNK